jgi:hypothetical protein
VSEIAGTVATHPDGTLPPQVLAFARHLAAVKAAMLVEASYFPEQVNTPGSAYEALSAQYEAGITRLWNAVKAIAPRGSAGPGQGFGSVAITTPTAVLAPYPPVPYSVTYVTPDQVP